jgi:predicted nucleic acid-binding protein
MEKQKAVADASIIVKWFLEEEYSENARLLRDSFLTEALTISVPSLLFYEVLNALRYSGMYNEDELALVARSLSQYGFDVWEPKGKLYEKTARLSLKQDISTYDAAYLTLAVQLKATFYTADLELLQKFPENTQHIKTFKPNV